MILKAMPDRVDYFLAVVVLCFTEKGDLVLLKKRKDHPLYPGLWGVPAGRVKKEKGEEVIEAAIREVQEETSNQIQPTDLSFFSLDPTVHCKPNGERFYFFCYSYYLNHGHYLTEVKIDPAEHEEFITVQPEKVLQMDKDLFVPDAWDNFRSFHGKIKKKAKGGVKVCP